MRENFWSVGRAIRWSNCRPSGGSFAVPVRSWIVVDAVETLRSLCSEGRVDPVANHDDGELAAQPGDPSAEREFVRSVLDVPPAWMTNDVGADSSGRSIVSSSSRPTTVTPNERSACRAAFNNDRDRIAQRLNDGIICEMFGVGLRLQATAQLADDTVQIRLQVAIRDLDLIIAEVRSVIFDRNSGLHQSCDDATSHSRPDCTAFFADELATSGKQAGAAWTCEGTGT